MREKLSAVDSVDLELSVWSLSDFRKFEVNQDLISGRQMVREEGGTGEIGLLEM